MGLPTNILQPKYLDCLHHLGVTPFILFTSIAYPLKLKIYGWGQRQEKNHKKNK